jgi:hypothetical protein
LIGTDAAALERRRQLILEHETGTARAIAVRVVEKPALSVWMILIPIVLLHYMHRHQTFKQGVEVVTKELLGTKLEALELACGTATASEIAGEVPAGSVRAAEKAEIAALAEHYRRLLGAQGDDYAALARHAYGAPEAYGRAMDRIAQAEHAVLAAAALQCEGMRELSQLSDTLERAREEVRRHQAKAIFGGR